MKGLVISDFLCMETVRVAIFRKQKKMILSQVAKTCGKI